ncbi:MAG: hypothetical protein ACLP1X_04060 [Polyangiaceae bacterium]
MPVAAAEACAVGLYALPLLAFLAARSTRKTGMTRLGLDIPFFVALDLLGIVLLACVVRLEVAILISRPAWLVGFGALAVKRRRAGRDFAGRPLALRFTVLVTVLASAALALAVSTTLSRHYVIWDRYWHSPLVTAIGVQRIPFVNVLEHTSKWRYHYAGDVFAAIFRGLSFDVISSNRALSIAHDVAFALTASTLALLMLGSGLTKGALAALGGVSILLCGPIPFLPGVSDPLFGFMHLNFLTISFRPHVSVAALLMVGFVGAATANPLAQPGAPREGVLGRLLAIAALMSLTDETSLALLDVALGVAWLPHPGILGVGRARGVAFLLAIGAMSVLPSVLLGGSFAPGGPVQKLGWAAAQVPSTDHFHANLTFPGEAAKKALFSDLLPFAIGGGGIALVLVATPSRALFSLLLFAMTATVVGAAFATHIQVNGESTVEAQRFLVAPFFAVFVIALLVLPRVPLGGFTSVVIVGTVALPAFFSLYWMITAVPERLASEKLGADPDTLDTYKVNCRTEAGTTFGEKASVMYIELHAYNMYATCRPIFTPGNEDPPWPTKIFAVTDPATQLREVEREVLSTEAQATAVCRADNAVPHDPVCIRLLKKRTSCRAAGLRFLQCPLSRADVSAILGH